MWGRSPEKAEMPDVRGAYEQGKHRRYNLLFAVNGGAFALVKFFIGPNAVPWPGDYLVGWLTYQQLSLGLALFTIVMVLDIFMFGQNMRNIQKRNIQNMREERPELGLFGWQGKLVLILIGGLIVSGWTLAAFDALGLLLLIIYLDSIGIVYVMDQTRDGRAKIVAIMLSVGILSFTAGVVVAVVAGAFVL